jgi:serine/threonine protein kinase
VPEDINIIKERFRIDSLIDYGGMARVYKGTDLTLARTVAIKVLSEDLAKDQSFLLRFRREAQAAAALTHPNIVAVYDTGAEAGLHYIVMEYVEGRSLQEMLDETGTLPTEQAAVLGADVARALAAAHEKGIVHRDVKPGNIMVSNSGLVKVMDFGIAKAATAGALTQVGSILGTVAYLSPEQARGEEVDGRSDIYSLGALIYQMLTGRPPFAAETLLEMVNKLNNQHPTRPSRLSPGIPPALEQVVMKALSKNPDRRQRTAEQLADELTLSLQGDPSPTAAYAAPIDGPEELEALGQPDKTLVAPAPFVDEVVSDESRTEVIAPVVQEREPIFPKRAVVGGIIVLALLLLGTVLLSNLRQPTVPLTDPSPTPTTSPGAVVTRAPRPPAAVTLPPTTPTTLPPAPSTEPVTEPPATEPPATVTQPPTQVQPPQNPGPGQDGNPGSNQAAAPGGDQAAGSDVVGGLPEGDPEA